MATMRWSALAATCSVMLGFGSQVAWALPGQLLGGVELAQPEQDATDRCDANAKRQEAKTEKLPAARPQAMAQGLVRSEMLTVLNRAKARHSFLDDPGGRKVGFLQLKKDGQEVVLGFAEQKLEAVAVRTRVTPDKTVGGDGNMFDPDRLKPWRDYRESLKAEGCSLSPADPKAPNHFVYEGQCGKSLVYLEYRPERDEVWVLYHSAKR